MGAAGGAVARAAAAVALWGCAPAAPQLGLAPGAWGLASVAAVEVEGRPAPAPVVGLLEVGLGAEAPRLSLAGGALSTGGAVEAAVLGPQAGEGPEVRWLRFPLRFGIGAAEGLLRIDEGRARLVLGYRPAEHDLDLRLEPGGATAKVALGPAERTASAALDRWAAAWAGGRLRLVDGAGAPVGDLAFFDDGAVLVDLYDPTWSTGGPAPAVRADEGGEILLTVPVEPALEGESALLLVNLAHHVVVVPSAPSPQAEDRWLRLEPGGPTPEERASHHAAATAAAIRAEQAWLSEALPRLAAAAESPLGCRPLSALGEEWGLMLRGYELSFGEQAGRCEARVEPRPPQHGRRVAGRAHAGGVAALQVVGAGVDLDADGAAGLVGPAPGR
ncbi:MAG: hypothetical protein JNM72_04025 [Deltaproteobacteria bacterium]|nr:hypothetical protein [Deltaproteobacteria bacterium]